MEREGRKQGKRNEGSGKRREGCRVQIGIGLGNEECKREGQVKGIVQECWVVGNFRI